MDHAKSLMIVGVGGQGTLLASRLIGNVLLNQGYDVKVSEVHGMSQRGGSVVTYVKYGEKVYSPVVDPGEADGIVAFEILEAARWLPYLKEDGKMIANSQQIDPMPVITGAVQYPQELAAEIRKAGGNLIAVDAVAIAQEAGSVKAVNIVLMGVLAKHMEFEKEHWIRAIEETVPKKFITMNLKAFEYGYALS